MESTLKRKLIKSVEHIKARGMGEFLSFKFHSYTDRLERSLGLLSSGIQAPKRILGVWDYRYFPWALGDSLTFAEALSIQKIRHQAEAIDLCIVYDPGNPGHGIKIYSHITPDNVQDYAFEYLPVFGMCFPLGSVYCFNSRTEFFRFFKMNAGRYVMYPQDFSVFEKPYIYKHCLDEILDFYKHNNYIPHLELKGKYAAWARGFYTQHLAPGQVPVVISLRKSPWDPERNANPGVWLSFIDKVNDSFPEVKFIIVGKRDEIIPELDNRKNVLVAKRFGTMMIEDCALVRTAAMYMGLDCGIHEPAKFADQPYIVCQCNTHEMWGLPEGKAFPFSTDLQRYYSVKVPVTVDFLFKEFIEIYPKAKVRLKDPIWQKK